MGVEIFEGFTHWDQNDPLVKWDTLGNYNNMTISSTYGRNGSGLSVLTGGFGGVNRLRVSSPGGSAASVMFEKYFTEPVTNINAGFAIKLNDEELAHPISLIAFIDTSAGESATILGSRYFKTQISLLLTPQQQLVFCYGESFGSPIESLHIVGPYSPPLKRGVFSYIELASSVGTPGSIRLWMDGKSIFSDSVTTQSTTHPSFGGVRFFNHLGQSPTYVRNYYIDDIYVTTSGSRFSDVVVETLLPNEFGALSQWTPSNGGTLNYDMVNELSPNDDTDYNTATAAGNIDTYGYSSLANTSGTIHGVAINAVGVNKDISSAGSIMIKGVYRQGGVNYETEWRQMGTLIYKANILSFLTNPATGNRFSISEINTNELGIDRVT